MPGDPRDYRLTEALGMLAMLHAPIGATVACVGQTAGVCVPEILRFQDVVRVYSAAPLPFGDRRVESVSMPPLASCDLIVLAPDQSPRSYFASLKPGGMVQASTTVSDLWGGLYHHLRQDLGSAIPWRENLPAPLFGVLARQGNGTIQRLRTPPKSAKRLSSKFLPCLFTFAPDELPLLRRVA